MSKEKVGFIVGFILVALNAFAFGISAQAETATVFKSNVHCHFKRASQDLVVKRWYDPGTDTAECQLGATCFEFKWMDGSNYEATAPMTPASRSFYREHLQDKYLLDARNHGEGWRSFMIVVAESQTLRDYGQKNPEKYEQLRAGTIVYKDEEILSYLNVSLAPPARDGVANPVFTADAVRKAGGSLSLDFPVLDAKTWERVTETITCRAETALEAD